ncbi:MAG: hypothetical protein GF364_02975, partial [Candidatus Lokiarchaeota archaeon]|nr:hypothetical protein [Candidatus Lokiarchaeota archaeon]
MTTKDEELQICSYIDEVNERYNLNIDDSQLSDMKEQWRRFQVHVTKLYNLKFRQMAVFIHNVADISESIQKIKRTLIIVDRVNLKPVSNAKVEIFIENFPEEKFTFSCNSQGVCEVDFPVFYEENRFSLEITAEGFQTLTLDSKTNTNVLIDQTQLENRYNLLLFSDRDQYKPGDTIHVLVWLVGQQGDTLYLNHYNNIQVKLFNNNQDLLSFNTIKPNKYGYITTDIHIESEIPEEENYKIQIDVVQEDNIVLSKTKQISIKRYKRPEIQIKTQNMKNSWFKNDDYEFFIDAEYFYGDKVKTGRLSVKIKDILGNIIKEKFQINEGNANVILSLRN